MKPWLMGALALAMLAGGCERQAVRGERKDPRMMQRGPGDQEASDDKEPPARVQTVPQLAQDPDPHLASPNG